MPLTAVSVRAYSSPVAERQWEVLPPEGEDAGARPRRPGRRSTSGPPRRRLGLALAIAVASDTASIWLEFVPPLEWALDLVTAAALYVVLGRQWVLLPALIAEAIPGLAAFPAWVLVVLSVGVMAKTRR